VQHRRVAEHDQHAAYDESQEDGQHRDDRRAALRDRLDDHVAGQPGALAA
jgi:hypothetical protein